MIQLSPKTPHKTPQIIPAGGLHGFDGNESPALPREGQAAGALNGAPVRGLVVRHLAILRPAVAVDGHPIGMLGMPRMGFIKSEVIIYMVYMCFPYRGDDHPSNFCYVIQCFDYGNVGQLVCD